MPTNASVRYFTFKLGDTLYPEADGVAVFGVFGHAQQAAG